MVFVDTEEEFDWSAPFRRDAIAVEAITALPDMHRRLADHGVAPCYLCDYPVATSAAAIDTLRGLIADGRSTIGAQLHPWVNPPHDEAPSGWASFAGNLDPALVAAKVDQLTAAITAAFGAQPLAFRTGRYGLGPGMPALLAARGYRVETSMRALHDYSAAGGPDFSAIGSAAFRLAPEGLIEVPLTTRYIGALRRGGGALHRLAGRIPRGRGVMARTGLLSRVPLSPEGVSFGEAAAAVREAVAAGERLLTFSFHSPSLVPGNTPYVRDAAGLARFHSWWDDMLALLEQMEVRPISLAELIAAADDAAPRGQHRRSGTECPSDRGGQGR
ncbi:polysaccharide deacetylase family protein [Sphingomonas sp. ABOLG]|uniref:polysaccharide deacetylase family protein n=1 Tax=Sphingomonas sp. ABOLG TaxID=1985880 RepID=UPI001F498351|nr:polysaccharide deacetylase family protein [Sphingomonas sp. ABOLG]